MASPKHPSDNSWTDRPVLVAGKSGQLARCLCDVAVQENLPLVSLGRSELDLGGHANIEEMIDRFAPAAIVNAAADTAVDQAEAKSESARAINRGGAARLAAAARTRGIPFVHLSTDYVFDGCKSSAYNEDDPTPAKRPKNSCLDSSKAHRTFRVQLAPWQTSLERCLDRLVVPAGLPAC